MPEAFPKLTNLTEEERAELEKFRKLAHEKYVQYSKSNTITRYAKGYMSGRFYGMYIVLSELLGHDIPYATMD